MKPVSQVKQHKTEQSKQACDFQTRVLEVSKNSNETSIAVKIFIDNFPQKFFILYTWHTLNIAKLFSLYVYF